MLEYLFLHQAQQKYLYSHHWTPGDVLMWDNIGTVHYAVADYLRLPPVQVYEVAAFYSMFETKPVGRIHVSVCTNISCMLRGADEIVAHVEKKLGIKKPA